MIRRSLITFCLAALLTLNGAPVAAQDDAIIGDPAVLDGVQASIQRFWSIDFVAASMSGTPIAEGSLPSGLLVAQASVSRFASEEQAAAGFATLVAEGMSEIAQVEADIGDQGEVTTEESDAFGNESFIYQAVVPVEEGGVIRVIVSRDGVDVFMTFAFGSDEESVTIADDLATWFIETGEASPEPQAFIATGASTGGLWGLMPPADDPVLRGLMPQEDEILFPRPETGA